MKSPDNRVRRNGSAKAATQQARKPGHRPHPAPHLPVVGPFTAEEASALKDIGNSVDWNTPAELESVAGHFVEDARKYRLAAAALRRTGLSRGWQWVIVPKIALGQAARGDDFEEQAERYGQVMGQFIRMHAAMIRSIGMFERLLSVLERSQGLDELAESVKAERDRLANANGLLADFFEEMTQSGGLDEELESAGAR